MGCNAFFQVFFERRVSAFTDLHIGALDHFPLYPSKVGEFIPKRADQLLLQVVVQVSRERDTSARYSSSGQDESKRTIVGCTGARRKGDTHIPPRFHDISSLFVSY